MDGTAVSDPTTLKLGRIECAEHLVSSILDSQGTESAGERKSPFDNLDRDELIKKCKGLLSIAQKAKKAKDGKRHTDPIHGNIANFFKPSIDGWWHL